MFCFVYIHASLLPPHIFFQINSHFFHSISWLKTILSAYAYVHSIFSISPIYSANRVGLSGHLSFTLFLCRNIHSIFFHFYYVSRILVYSPIFRTLCSFAAFAFFLKYSFRHSLSTLSNAVFRFTYNVYILASFSIMFFSAIK